MSEYLSLEEACRYIEGKGYAKHQFIDCVMKNHLQLCFQYCGTLTYNYPQIKDWTESFDFTGYIAPIAVDAQNIIIQMLKIDQLAMPFRLNEVVIVEVRYFKLSVSASELLAYCHPEVVRKIEVNLTDAYQVNMAALQGKLLTVGDILFSKEQIDLVFVNRAMPSLANKKTPVSQDDLIYNMFKDAILDALESLGLDPTALPKKKNSSVGGVRKMVREYLTVHPEYGDLMKDIKPPYHKFNNYWSLLRNAEVLIDSSE